MEEVYRVLTQGSRLPSATPISPGNADKHSVSGVFFLLQSFATRFFWVLTVHLPPGYYPWDHGIAGIDQRSGKPVKACLKRIRVTEITTTVRQDGIECPV